MNRPWEPRGSKAEDGGGVQSTSQHGPVVRQWPPPREAAKRGGIQTRRACGGGGGSARQTGQGAPKAAGSPLFQHKIRWGRGQAEAGPRGNTRPPRQRDDSLCQARVTGHVGEQGPRLGEYDAGPLGRHRGFGSAAHCDLTPSQHAWLPARYAGLSPKSTPPTPPAPWRASWPLDGKGCVHCIHRIAKGFGPTTAVSRGLSDGIGWWQGLMLRAARRRQFNAPWRQQAISVAAPCWSSSGGDWGLTNRPTPNQLHRGLSTSNASHNQAQGRQ